ncbi:hypothetical protein HanXRQr2_Chr05g0203401 [Helianthus annuus]|uniref:Uncharacterized protein n=1 Tax=Helianthus annuus TaxID=4232 RepID=A0A9K3IXN5_HELAN|nr:hypothetical protein HanXRQr2_Chr05g0203401 [Helianthus annuus]
MCFLILCNLYNIKEKGRWLLLPAFSLLILYAVLSFNTFIIFFQIFLLPLLSLSGLSSQRFTGHSIHHLHRCIIFSCCKQIDSKVFCWFLRK